MNLYIPLIKPLLEYENYVKYYPYINLDFLSTNYRDVYRIYQVLPKLHEDTGKNFNVDDLRLTFYANYPNADAKSYDQLFNHISEAAVDPKVVQNYLEKTTQQERALQLAKLALQAAEGTIPFEEVSQRLKALEEAAPKNNEWREFLVSDSIADIQAHMQMGGGVRWRMDSLNRALGPLRKGNFGFLFARPESGKTTFLSSELTFMAGQVDRPILWFNNEQAGPEVRQRIFEAALGKTKKELREGNFQEEYDRLTKKNLWLYDSADVGKRDIESICREVNPSLIVFDQIDNIKGFNADRNDLELKVIYQWARELGKEYGPSIGVCQAGASGEDKKWLTMNDVDNSKTAKQGAADWILGIGKIHEPGSEYLRFLHLSKNKLAGDDDSDSKMRHGKWQVLIKPEIARYIDL